MNPEPPNTVTTRAIPVSPQSRKRPAPSYNRRAGDEPRKRPPGRSGRRQAAAARSTRRLAPDKEELLAEEAPGKGQLQVKPDQERGLRQPRASRIGQKARDHRPHLKAAHSHTPGTHVS